MLVDAAITGIPVLSPSDTWMADQIDEFGIGATYREGDLESLQEALGEMKGHLTAIDTHGIAVEDCEGGIWHPSDDAAAEIAATDDPCAAAVKMCRTAPLRGRWSS